MTTNPDDKRNLIIVADTEDELREKLRKIPGYEHVALTAELRRRMSLSSNEDRFFLEAANGERIIVCHTPSPHRSISVAP